jgi:hypothetical protein
MKDRLLGCLFDAPCEGTSSTFIAAALDAALIRFDVLIDDHDATSSSDRPNVEELVLFPRRLARFVPRLYRRLLGAH